MTRQAHAERRELDAAWQTAEQLDSQVLLQQADALGQRRLRDAELDGSGSETASLGDLEEVFELSQVDHAATSLASTPSIFVFTAPATASSQHQRSGNIQPCPAATRSASPRTPDAASVSRSKA